LDERLRRLKLREIPRQNATLAKLAVQIPGGKVSVPLRVRVGVTIYVALSAPSPIVLWAAFLGSVIIERSIRKRPLAYAQPLVCMAAAYCILSSGRKLTGDAFSTSHRTSCRASVFLARGVLAAWRRRRPRRRPSSWKPRLAWVRCEISRFSVACRHALCLTKPVASEDT
jgi:hypothetical protein